MIQWTHRIIPLSKTNHTATKKKQRNVKFSLILAQYKILDDFFTCLIIFFKSVVVSFSLLPLLFEKFEIPWEISSGLTPRKWNEFVRGCSKIVLFIHIHICMPYTRLYLIIIIIFYCFNRFFYCKILSRYTLCIFEMT